MTEKKKETGKDGKTKTGKEGKTREEIGTKGLYPAWPDTEDRYPSMPETWNVAESKPGKEVSGMAGYERHVSGNDGKSWTGKDGKRREEIDTMELYPSMPE